MDVSLRPSIVKEVAIILESLTYMYGPLYIYKYDIYQDFKADHNFGGNCSPR